MGLFNSNRQATPTRGGVQNKKADSNVYVLARSTTRSSSFGSSESRPTWSLCVEESSNQGGSSFQYPQPKKNRSIFNLKRKPAEFNVSSVTSTQPLNSQAQFIDFSLKDGELNISRPSSTLPATPSSHSDDVLLQILLPTKMAPTQSPQSLSTRLEQLLYQITSSQSHLHNQESDAWIRLVLITLQQSSNLLPHPPSFDINDFMSFAQNQLTEFEAEVLSKTQHDDDGVLGTEMEDSRVKIVNYQSHVEERTRLKKLISQNYNRNGDGEAGCGGEGEDQGEMQTSWWKNGPQVAETSREYDRDVEVDRDEPRGFM